MEGFTLSTCIHHPFTFFPTTKTTRPNFNFFVSASKEAEQHFWDEPHLRLPPKPKSKKKIQILDDENPLRRPVPKKGIKFNTDPTPVGNKFSIRKKLVDGHNFDDDDDAAKASSASAATAATAVPNIVLRKPSSAFPEDDIEPPKSSRRLTIQSNLLLRMSKDKTREDFSDITLLKKPQPVSPAIDSDQIDKKSSNAVSVSLQPNEAESSYDVLSTNSIENHTEETTETSDHSFSEMSQEVGDASVIEAAALQGKPQRLDQSTDEKYHIFRVETDRMTNNSYDPVKTEDLMADTPLQEREDADWTRAEDLFHTGERVEVELISCSSRGFVGSFGSLIGFLPYRNLGAKWKFLAFESWVRQKGLDPSVYKQNLGIIGVHELQNRSPSLDSNLIPEKIERQLSPHMKLDDLLNLYDQEKTKFLSSFVGQKIKVSVVLADRKSRRLMFSGRPKQNEELVEKKRNLMAKLSVGDVVKCCIKKITYFGIFVEVEGIPALIHQSEVSWDAIFDPSSFLKIGQIVEAKVHQLDFTLERIQLSLKEITPDPLIEALESVVGDGNSLDGRREASQADVEWDEVESLIKQLQQMEDVQSVSKGRFFLSPGLAPTFQVYMASMFENRYKLLARAGNKVQEVIVQASLDKEEMKAAILTCTNRVE